MLNNRGLLARINDRYMVSDGSERFLVSIVDMAAKMKDIYAGTPLRLVQSRNCIEFAGANTWKTIVDKWNDVIDKQNP